MSWDVSLVPSCLANGESWACTKTKMGSGSIGMAYAPLVVRLSVRRGKKKLEERTGSARGPWSPTPQDAQG